MRFKKDRREHRRYAVKTGIIAEIGPYAARAGRIIDISTEGLSFQYIANPGNRRHDARGLNIWGGNEEFSIIDIPFEQKADRLISEVDREHSTSIRRCSVKFVDLPRFKVRKLKRIIRRYGKNSQIQPAEPDNR